jgi:hypothetical protein
MMNMNMLWFLLFCGGGGSHDVSFSSSITTVQALSLWTPSSSSSLASRRRNSGDEKDTLPSATIHTASTSRRQAIAKLSTMTTTAVVLTSTGRPYSIANAAETTVQNMETTTTTTTPPIEMKEFVDPYGLFTIQVPTGFYTLRRKAKGDLPNEQTGKGRRGSSIFTAGNMAKAEIIAVERFPTRVLLEENGIDASTGKLSTFTDLGEPSAIANLINLRREKDKPGVSNTIIAKDSVQVSPNGQVLMFQLKTEIEVQKPELLMEQYGVSQLFRITTAKASLESHDGNMLAVFASALETDFQGPDGPALQAAVDSFQATEREYGF